MPPGSGEKIGTETRILQLVRVGGGCAAVDPRHLRAERDDEHRQEGPGDDQRRVDAEPRDQRRRERRADAHRRQPQHLDHAEDPREHVVGHAALDEREPGDVDERVADAHEGERDECDRDLLPEADGHERDPGDDETAEERGAEPLRTGERERGDGSDERADSDRRVEIAHAALPEVEQVDRHDDDEAPATRRTSPSGP